MSTRQPPVIVLGAGIAGLTAANALMRRGVRCEVFEAGPQVAGMAASRTDADGFSYDVGAHFITNRLAAAIGVSGHCSVVRRYGESVRLRNGIERRYPLGLMRSGRFMTSALAQRLRHHAAPPESLAAHFVRAYGRALADEVAIPLARAWSGRSAHDLSRAAADKIPTSIAQTLYLRLMQRITGRAVAIGYCGELPQQAGVFHVYPRGGVARLCQRLADVLPAGSVRLNSPAQRIHVENGRAVGVTAGGRTVEASGVVSTLPLNRLPELVEGSDAADEFRRLRFRGIVLVNLKLKGRGLLNDVVVWTPDGFPFYRVTEAPLSMEHLAPHGRTMLLCDIGADPGDEYWQMDDEALARRCLSALEPLVPDVASRYLGARVLRQALAYPVFALEYETLRRRFVEQGTGIAGLLSIGRNGEFDHVLMEDIYWRTQRRIGALCREGGLHRLDRTAMSETTSGASADSGLPLSSPAAG